MGLTLFILGFRSAMASRFSAEVVAYEYDKKKPYFQCNSCPVKETKRTMEDHIVHRHLQGPAPYECALCAKKFARKDPARSHVTKTHSGKTYAEVIVEEPDIREDLIVKHASLLTRSEGLEAHREKMLEKENKGRVRKPAEAAGSLKDCNRTLVDPSDASAAKDETFIDLTASPAPSKKRKVTAQELDLITSEDEVRESPPVRSIWDRIAPTTPALSLHPPADDLLLSPLSQVSAPGVPCMGPTMPSLLDVMGLLSQVSQNQEKALSRLGGIEKKQTAQAKKLEQVEQSVLRHQRACASAQGECRSVKEELRDLRRDLGKATEGTKEITEAAKSMRESREKIEWVEGTVRQMSTGQTRTTNRARAALRELFHGVQRSLDAFENRPAAHLVPRNDEGRTVREERARRPLEM